MPNPIEERLSDGFFQANVFTANQALPIEGAVVQIFSGKENEPRFLLHTNENGATERVSLQAPAAELSRSPGTPEPFSDYRVTVSADGYYTLTVAHLPVFAGVTSDLPAQLVPLSAFLSGGLVPGGETRTVPENPQALSEESQ